MRFNAKKNLLASSVAEVRNITSILSLKDDGSKPVLRLRTVKNGLKVASSYAEASIAEVTIEEEGEVFVDMQSLQQALSVSGSNFKFSLDGSSAFFSCGRSKGRVARREGEFNDSILSQAPKATIHVPAFGALLSSLALKAPGSDSDRTLHFVKSDKTIRGESSDGFRGVITVATVDDYAEFDSESLSLPQKACDQLAKMVEEAKIGFNDRFFSVQGLGIKVVMPLSPNPPLDILGQMNAWLGQQSSYGAFDVKVDEIKNALVDAMAMIGKNVQAQLDLVATGGIDSKFEGYSEAGGIESELEFISSTIKDATISLSGPYLKECLDFYKFDGVRCKVYDNAVVLDLINEGDTITRQTSIVPLVSPVKGESLGDSSDEEPEPESKPKRKKKTSASKKKKEEPKPVEEEEEEGGIDVFEPSSEDFDDETFDDED